jgi:hypothetical protein
VNYFLPKTGQISIKLTDLSGRLITQFKGEQLSGEHTWQPDGLENWPSGLYFCQFQTETLHKTIKLVKD